MSEEIRLAKRLFGLAETAPVVSCFEAGRCGFWPHWALEGLGVRNLVVDSSSIEVNRRKRRAKSDDLDAGGLSTLLVRYCAGDRRAWKLVRVPPPEAEDLRHLMRERVCLSRERTRCIARVKGILATQGAELVKTLDESRCWNGARLPPILHRRAAAEIDRVAMIDRQIAELKAERRRIMRRLPVRLRAQLKGLMRLRGIGSETAWLLVLEFFGWRSFDNVRELGALAGLAPTPYQSGEMRRELGISKAGNRLIRWILVEIAWKWLQHQPQSELARWFRARWNSGSRSRRIGIVAVARKLLCALWRYLETGVPPVGALLKA